MYVLLLRYWVKLQSVQVSSHGGLSATRNPLIFLRPALRHGREKGWNNPHWDNNGARSGIIVQLVNRTCKELFSLHRLRPERVCGEDGVPLGVQVLLRRVPELLQAVLQARQRHRHAERAPAARGVPAGREGRVSERGDKVQDQDQSR